MAVVFTATNASVSALSGDIVTSALHELGVIAAEETPSAADAAWGLEKLQRMVDSFNARRNVIYNVNFTRFTLKANHAPHTIGPNGDFQMAARPVKLVSAALVLTSSSAIDLPIAVQDDDWWAAQRLKDLTSTYPTNVYYSPDAPLGNLYFWPVATQVNDVRLETWVSLTQAIDLKTALVMPQGYWDAVVLSLALRLAPSFPGVPLSPLLVGQQKEAMKAIMDNNNPSPRMSTRDAGMGSEKRTRFNFLTGEPW